MGFLQRTSAAERVARLQSKRVITSVLLVSIEVSEFRIGSWEELCVT